MVVLRLSLHTVSSSMWQGVNRQLSQLGWFKIGANVWLFVHIQTEAYGIWRKPLFCAVCNWRQCKKKNDAKAWHRFVKVELKLSAVVRNNAAHALEVRCRGTEEVHVKHSHSCFLSVNVKLLEWMSVYYCCGTNDLKRPFFVWLESGSALGKNKF